MRRSVRSSSVREEVVTKEQLAAGRKAQTWAAPLQELIIEAFQEGPGEEVEPQG